MKKLKVVTIVGTRPEIIRLARVIPKLDSFFDHSLIHTGQNYDYELNQIFFDDLELRMPDYFLNAAGKSSMETIGNIIKGKLSTSEALAIYPKPVPVLRKPNETKADEVFPPTEI